MRNSDILQSIISSHMEIPINPLNTRSEPTIALLHCMDLIEDFLDHINISFEGFCNEFVGSWMFSYIEALQKVNIKTVLFCVSASVDQPSHFTHQPTGATICVLPTSKSYLAYRAVREKALKVYGGSAEKSFKNIQDPNISRHFLLKKLKNLMQSLGTYLSTPLELLTREIQHFGCHAILCQEYEYARFDVCVLLGKLINLPVFATFQGGNKIHSVLEYPLRLWALRACTGLIIASHTEIQRVNIHYGVPNTKIARIFNPVDLGKWRAIDRTYAKTALGIPLNARVVVCHGRIDIHRKGLDILLDAWKKIYSDRLDQDLRLMLIGTGPDAEKLRQCITIMQLRGVMWIDEFVNDRTRLQQYLSAADVYTLTSRQEGFPVAPLEAMACELPVVATDASGVSDILEGGEISGGLVVPQEDTAALALTLGRVLDHQVWSQQLGKCARRRIEEYFSLEVIAQQLRDFLVGEKN